MFNFVSRGDHERAVEVDYPRIDRIYPMGIGELAKA